MPSLSRRQFLSTFLKGAGCFVAAATFPFVPHVQPGRRAPRYHFPQGVASGDPTPDTVVLWTRVQPLEAADAGAAVEVSAQLSATPDFATVLMERTVPVGRASDHTLRLVVQALEPDTTYYYRFVAGSDVTDLVGRTRTAPAPDADRPVRFAFASCQSYEAGFYHAYRDLVAADEQAPEGEGLDFVLHLGDFVYEKPGYGEARPMPPLPSGAPFATTLDDYRHLYKVYLTDPDLRAARARWPFVQTWDDHEFTNDAWQSWATYETGADPAQTRKLAANQAWFEFIPALLTDHPGSGGVPSEAQDFAAAAVADAPPSAAADEAGLDREPNNLAALASLAIYRQFRWGRHLDLVVTDSRSYRTPHPIPPEINRQVAGTTRYLTPVSLVEVFDAGRTYADGNPPAELPAGEAFVPNTRRDAPPGTLLGARQKAWWKRAMQTSDATWRVWGHSVPLLPLRLDLDQIDPEAAELVFTTDTWKGYLAERRELLAFLADERIANVVALSGDNHNHFAGVFAPNFDADALQPVGAEFSVCGISSPSVFQGMAGAVEPDEPLRPLVVQEWEGAVVPAINMTWRWGARSSMVLAQTGELAQARAARNPRQNRHLRYVDSDAYGLGLVTVGADDIATQFVTYAAPVDPDEATVLRRAHFTVPAWQPGEAARLDPPQIEGTPPFPVAS